MLHKFKRLIVTVIISLVAFGTVTASALDNTTYTYTVSVDDNWIRTQDAYIPSAILAKNIGLSEPGDIFYLSGKLYISDTNNSRIAVLDIKTGEAQFFGGKELNKPDGLFVEKDGTIYVADPGSDAVLVYTPDYKLKMTIARPKSYLFSQSSLYSPCAVAVSSVGNIFVVGKGAYEGIMQFDKNGEFFGYFAANKYKMSAIEKFQELMFNEQQLSNLFVRTPRPIDNIDISPNDLIFSVTRGDERTDISYQSTADDTLKMHNMAGLNIFAESGNMKEEWNFTDVASGINGTVFSVTQTGIINEYDNQGNLIFTFGGRAYDNDRNGVFTNAQAIDIDPQNGTIFVLDSERALVQVFYPTDFAKLTHNAIASLENGDYEGGEDIWASLLRLNGMSQIAHIGYGKSLFYQQKYDEALEHFKIAGDVAYYSDAKWEIRSRWFNENMKYLLMGFFLIAVLLVLKSILKKKGIFKTKEKIYSDKNKSFLRDISYLRLILKHPLDSYYYLRKGEKGSVLSATVIYMLFFIVFICDNLVRGYIFRPANYNSITPVSLSLLFSIPLVLWLIGNYMIGTINEGEGYFKQIYVCTSYAFAPYIILTPFVIALSHILTLNEGFIVDLGSLFIVVWAAVLVFLSVKEVQQYKFGETVKSVFLVIFFMVMVIVAFVIVYLLIGKIVGFAQEIIVEGMYRVSQ